MVAARRGVHYWEKNGARGGQGFFFQVVEAVVSSPSTKRGYLGV